MNTETNRVMPPSTRRNVLYFSGVVGVGGLAGCLGGSITAGTLVVSNDDDQSHTATVTISKTSENEEDLPSRPHDAGAPTTTPLWQRDYQLEVPAGARRERSDVLTDPGAYYITARTESGGPDSTWLGLYAAGSDGDQVAESHISVTITERGGVTLGTPTDD